MVFLKYSQQFDFTMQGQQKNHQQLLMVSISFC